MGGTWFGNILYSKPRAMARFGLLMLNKGIWATDTILHDQAYYNAMTTTSQTLNKSYGYLWWLNGKSSYMVPSSQIIIPSSLIPNAPPDMFCALGKNDQKIYVIPSQNMVVIRMGNPGTTSVLAISAYDNVLWAKINDLNCNTSVTNQPQAQTSFTLYPNPAQSTLNINTSSTQKHTATITNALGQIIAQQNFSQTTSFPIQNLNSGMYFIKFTNPQGQLLGTYKWLKN
jgi:CubicO group peptidase (beta-lactamase class C family)